MAQYHYKRSGKQVVAAFERLLKTGDVEKITPGLYDVLIQHGGFIAHYDIHVFRATFKNKMTELLAGEFYRLDDPARWEADRMAHLEDADYSDGQTAGDVMRAIARIGARYSNAVQLRERLERGAAEVALARQLAEKHGYKVV